MNQFIDEFDMITRWPKKPVDKKKVISWLAEKFEFDKQYSEKQINQIIKTHHSFNDIPLLRRELVSNKFLSRKDDGSVYWKNL
tara:strand:+ start:2943 stop:3191 length:249 start_codon:yes stop_codon:yes gene_type:complete